jgi:chromosomal replication initiator protein
MRHVQPHVIWEEFLKLAKEEAGSQVVETWFKAVSLDAIDTLRQEVTLVMPNSFVSNWIQEHYHTLLLTHLKRLLNTTTLSIIFAGAHAPKNPSSAQELTPAIASTPTFRPAIITKMNSSQLVPHASQQKPKEAPSLNENYRFDTFVVGPNNSLAHGAAYAVSQALGTVYNPLFIYGGTGLGKTHLLHAIGNETKRLNPSIKVRYETSDQFMHDFIRSIRFDKAHQFRERYLNIDLLLIDDIQFFSNKEQTQETFFHIFNALHEQKKQIVLSSDTFPEEIKGLQSRLISRMEWGLVADMQTPDLETKIAILTKKAEQHGINLDDEVGHFIASRVHTNIRQLEGALIRVDAFASLTGQPISLTLAKRVLINFNEPRPHTIDLPDIATHISKKYGVSIADLKSKNRNKDVAAARQIACFMMKKLTSHSLQSIGQFFNGRDHSTIIHSITTIEERCKTDRHFAGKLQRIEEEILHR